MGICFRIWPLGNGSRIWWKRKWCDRAFSPSAFKNSNSKTAASIYGNGQMLMHPVMLQFPPIQNHSNDWWSTLFSLRAIWPLIAMNVVQAVKYFDMTAYLSKKMKQKLVKWSIISKPYPTRCKQTRNTKGNKMPRNWVFFFFYKKSLHPVRMQLLMLMHYGVVATPAVI